MAIASDQTPERMSYDVLVRNYHRTDPDHQPHNVVTAAQSSITGSTTTASSPLRPAFAYSNLNGYIGL